MNEAQTVSAEEVFKSYCTKKSPSLPKKSSIVILNIRWTLKYSDELELSSTFLEQWTLDASGDIH